MRELPIRMAMSTTPWERDVQTGVNRELNAARRSLTAACTVAVLLLAAGAGAAGETRDGSRASTPLTFEEHVRPIFKAMCFQCHGEEEELQGGLDLRLVRLMTAGGDSGSAVVPQDVKASLLWQRIEADEMPEGAKKLTPEQKSIVRQWIAQGAATARPEPANVEDARFSAEELAHWAFQPVRRPSVPRPAGYELSTPIDGFIAERLATQEIPFSPSADRRTLIRRVTFDLIGLPPTPEEVRVFVSDTSPDAYGRLIDRLLSSPQFGVRWGRHWLDIAGFAESDGGPGTDNLRPHAWRYRDYVIDSFNANKPIDTFLREQLAGDEMIEGPLDADNDRQVELLTATGFLRMGPDPTGSSNTLADRNMAAADAVKVVSSVMLGLTVECAQCHDHKYEPIGIDDYYRFRAVFDPLFPLHDWQLPDARLVDLTTDEVRAEAERIIAAAKAQEDELRSRVKAHAAGIQEHKLADVPEDVREQVRAAVNISRGDLTDEQQELLAQYPMVKSVSKIMGQLIEYDMPAYREFQKEKAKIAEFESTKPPLRMIMAATERPGVVPTSAVFFRGDPESPREPVAPGELTVLSRTDRDVSLPVNDESLATTGRRLTYAKHLTDGNHPLTARVFVNRVWQHHFGRGLVATPGDFGLGGSPPSHPALLDWLADDFVRHGWDVKRLHRMLLLSTTYQQLSERTSELDAIDPENELLGRMSLRRLEAEAIRDAVFTVSGKLNGTMGGPSVPVTEDAEGKVVIGRTQTRDGLFYKVEGQGANAFRRSAFIEAQRSLPLNMLATFDQPVMNPNCDLRQHSTVATQSLWFLNDNLLVQRAEDLAQRLFSNVPGGSAERVQQLFERLFAAPPTAEEQRACEEFLAGQAQCFREDPDEKWQAEVARSPDAPEVRALAALCQTLLASNRFLYVE